MPKGKKIKIIATPPGQAPEDIREKWVGVEMPIAEDAPVQKDAVQFGVKGGEPENLDGYPVEPELAIRALSEKNPEAARWWRENVDLQQIHWFGFSKNACEVIE